MPPQPTNQCPVPTRAAWWLLQAIDHTTHVLSLKYNRTVGAPVVFNTYQAYLTVRVGGWVWLAVCATCGCKPASLLTLMPPASRPAPLPLFPPCLPSTPTGQLQPAARRHGARAA
jgi:hypothetical protein